MRLEEEKQQKKKQQKTAAEGEEAQEETAAGAGERGLQKGDGGLPRRMPSLRLATVPAWPIKIIIKPQPRVAWLESYGQHWR